MRDADDLMMSLSLDEDEAINNLSALVKRREFFYRTFVLGNPAFFGRPYRWFENYSDVLRGIGRSEALKDADFEERVMATNKEPLFSVYHFDGNDTGDGSDSVGVNDTSDGNDSVGVNDTGDGNDAVDGGGVSG